MEWEQDDSIDILEIKRTIFGASIPSTGKSNATSQQDTSILSHLDVAQPVVSPHEKSALLPNGTSDKSIAHYTSTVNGSENASAHNHASSPSQLPSTVPDSHDLRHTQVSSISPETRKLQSRLVRARTMNNSENDLDDTQPLSQSVYETFVSKSRSIIEPDARQQGILSVVQEQQSVQEQESGHIDLLSGFKNGGALTDEQDGEDDATSEPENFSPTQPSIPLPRLPDSQRFKTPATAGKKRDFMGQTVEKTPVNHNPFASANKTPAPVMGLSQLFRTTQAISSPVMNLVSDPSDRPSPNLDVNDRPVTASSPLVSIKPHSRFQRASTEPSTNYISMKHSQAERHKDANDKSQREDESDDAFDEEPSLLERQRWERERERRFRAQSDAMLGSKKSHHSVPVPENDSEEETDYDDLSSQKFEKTPRIETEEDKENIEIPIQVPRTTAKLQEALLISDSSPLSTRNTWQQTHETPRSQPTAQRRADGSFAIADSQRSVGEHEERIGRDINPSQYATSSAGEVVIPQSQPQPRGYKAKPGVVPNVVDHNDVDGLTMQDEQETPREDMTGNEIVKTTGPEIHESHARFHQTNGTGKLTEQIARGGDTTTMQHRQTSTSSHNPSPKEQSNGSTKFDTAPSELPPLNHSTRSSSQRSMQSPPNRPMKRMVDIAEEPSPQRSSANTDFIPDILTADDKQFMRVVEGSSPPSSPIRAGRRTERRRLVDSSPASTSGLDTRPSQLPQIISEISSASGSVPKMANTRRLKSVVARTPAAESLTANRVWDLPDSPPKQPTTIQKKRKLSLEQQGEVTIEPTDRPSELIDEIVPPEPLTTRSSSSANRFAQANENIQSLRNDQEPEVPEPAEHSETMHLRPNQIFACFNGKSRAYYPARCLGIANADPLRYRIQWEGFAPDEIDAHGIKRLELRIGDTVKVGLDGFPKVPHVVQGFKDKIPLGVDTGEPENEELITDVFGYKTILVVPKQRKSLVEAVISSEQAGLIEVPISKVYLDSNMWSHFKDREFFLATSNSVPNPFVAKTGTSRSSGFITPADRPSTPISPPSRTRRVTEIISTTHPFTSTAPTLSPATETGLFATMLFVLSIDEPTQKSELVHLIRRHSGTILDDGFDALFTTNTSSTASSTSSDSDNTSAEPLAILPSMTRYTFTALITPDFSRKTKYMQALSLGIPCLSPTWLATCISLSRLVPWHPYLLAAGKSLFLDGATKSRILPVGQSQRFTDMLSHRSKPLAASSVVFITGKSKADDRKAGPYLFLLRAMGAHVVVRVFDLDSAKSAVRGILGADGERMVLVVMDDKDVMVAKDVFIRDAAGDGSKKKNNNKRIKTSATTAVASQKKILNNNTRDNKLVSSSRVQVVGTDFVAQTCIMGQLPDGFGSVGVDDMYMRKWGGSGIGWMAS